MTHVGWMLSGGATIHGAVDRSVLTGDVKTAGINFVSHDQAGSKLFRIGDATAGLVPGAQYQVRLAHGDFSGAASNQIACSIKDGSTVFGSYMFPTDIGGDHYGDATGVVRTSTADWVANNAPLVVTMISNSLDLDLSDPGSLIGNNKIAYTEIQRLS